MMLDTSCKRTKASK